MALKVRMCAADQKRFERGDEWFEFDFDRLFNDTPVGVQEDIEEATGVSLIEFASSLGRGLTRALRWRLWVARYLAGVREPFDAFDPAVHNADWELPDDEDLVEADASPPGQAPDQGQSQDA